jgi:hypothetical protein
MRNSVLKPHPEGNRVFLGRNDTVTDVAGRDTSKGPELVHAPATHVEQSPAAQNHKVAPYEAQVTRRARKKGPTAAGKLAFFFKAVTAGDSRGQVGDLGE